MGKVTNTYNVELVGKILKTDSVLKDMWEKRVMNKITLYRVCSEQEAINTWFYCLAGGDFRNLTRIKSSEADAVKQVSESEGIPQDPGRLARMLAVLEQKNKTKNFQIHETEQRVNVEYSQDSKTKLTDKLNGVKIKVEVNRNYTNDGSQLQGEGRGIVVQVGTPLYSVTIDEKLLGTVFPDYTILSKIT